MPSSVIRRFTDADHYAASIRGVSAEVNLMGRGDFAATLTRIDLHDVWMQRFSDSLPRIIHSGAPSPGRTGILFRTGSGPAMRWNSMEMDPGAVIHYGNDFDAFQTSSGPSMFGSMSLDSEKLESYAVSLAGLDLPRLGSGTRFTPQPSVVTKLLRLHGAIANLAEMAPEIIAHPEVARGLEQSLIRVWVTCLSTADPADDSSAQRHHEKIMRRFHAVIAGHHDTAVYVADLCAAVGVPERTLRLCCQESLGMGPKQYLLRRRMNLAQQALRKADPSTTTVTDVAAGFGFWNFGRFAVEYKALFGESPSATLRALPR